MRPAQLPVHSQNYSSLRKRSFKSACRRAVVAQQPVSYRGQQLTPAQVRRSGNCPPRRSSRSSDRPLRPRAGLANRDLRVLSWNAGHLGQQQWAEIKSWLQTEARQVCDIFVLQETHWQASAEFSMAGWYCISSASEYVPTEEDNILGGTAQPAPTVPAELCPTNPAPSAKAYEARRAHPPLRPTESRSFCPQKSLPTLFAGRNTLRDVCWRLALTGMVPGLRS